MDRAGAAVNTELGKDVDEVALDGGLGDEEGTGDLLVRRSGCEETEHVDLAVGETWEWAAHALEHPGGEIGGEYRVAGCGTLDAVDDDVGVDFFEEVTRCACFDCPPMCDISLKKRA